MKAWAQPYAYIRRSVASRADPGDISRDFQTNAVRGLAGDDADRLVILDGDWGRSAATDKTARRLAFLSLMEKVEAGEVSALYAYSGDRLARSVEWASRLWNACKRAGVPITTTTYRFNPANRDDDGGWSIWHYQAVGNEQALMGMERKAKASVERRQARNEAAGLPPNHGMGRKRYGARDGEDLRLVLEAFDKAGSFSGAAKLLNGEAEVCSKACERDHEHVGPKVATRDGSRWTGTVVGRIVQRERRDIAKQVRRGVAAKAPRMFTGLLLCDCGHRLTSMPRRAGVNGQKTETVGYFCAEGRNQANHPKPYTIAERKVLAHVAGVFAEFNALWHMKPDPSKVAPEDLAERLADLDAKRDRWVEQYGEGLIDRAARDKRLAAIALERDEVEAQIGALTDLATRRERIIDWGAPPAEVNARLRLYLDHIDIVHEHGTIRPTITAGGWVRGLNEWVWGSPEAKR